MPCLPPVACFCLLFSSLFDKKVGGKKGEEFKVICVVFAVIVSRVQGGLLRLQQQRIARDHWILSGHSVSNTAGFTDICGEIGLDVYDTTKDDICFF